MPIHKWRKRPTRFFGDVWVPFAHIDLQRTDGVFQPFVLQIDSGAVVSLLRRSVAQLLNVPLESGRNVEFTSIGGAQTTAYVHDVQTRFAPEIAYKVPYAIATVENVPNLLGRLGVIDRLQVDFDATLEETVIGAPWLAPDQRRIWHFLLETERHILSRWEELDLDKPARQLACRFIERAGQIVACAMGLLKLHRPYAAPALIRSLFELALQFEHLMNDPVRRSQQYIDFTWVTKHKQSRAIAENPTGFISRRVAESPMRAEGEAQNKAEYERVRGQFMHGQDKLWDKWYCKTVLDLARELGWDGEYRVVYASCAAWAHGDPFSTQDTRSYSFANSDDLFILSVHYVGQMLLRIADVGKLVLTSEQYDFLKKSAIQIC